MRGPGPRHRLRPGVDRGFALLIVLWMLVLITLLVATMSAAGRSEVRITASLRAAEIAREAVDGGVEEAIFRVATGQWGPGPIPQRIRVGEVLVEVRVEDEAGKVNVNDVPPELMNALLQEIGVPPATAASLTAAIEDFHSSRIEPLPGGAKAPQYLAAGLPYGPSSKPFRSLDEVRLVLGMTPEIFARLAPYISVTKVTGLDLAKADPVVRHASAAVSALRAQFPPTTFDPSGALTVQIFGRTVSGPAGATRHAVVRLGQGRSVVDSLYRLLSWD
jgi:general secretion pathway protein K